MRASENFRDDEAETVCITAERQDRLGCMFEVRNNGDIVVSDFHSIPGVFNRALTKYKDANGRLRVAIDAINGQFVPSYASVEMVKSAINRSWKADQRVEIWLCDDERKQWVHSLCNEAQP